MSAVSLDRYTDRYTCDWCMLQVEVQSEKNPKGWTAPDNLTDLCPDCSETRKKALDRAVDEARAERMSKVST